MMNDFQNILVVRTDRIGDLVLTTPALKALRAAYPSAKISVLVSEHNRDLVDGNPSIDEVLVDDRKGEHRGALGFFKLALSLRRQRFDLAIIFHTKRRTNLLCWMAGIPERIGYRNEKYGFLLNHPIEDTRHHGEKHEAEYCLDVLKPLGIESAELQTFLPVNDVCEQWVKRLYEMNGFSSKDRIVALHPGASDPSKMWPIRRFADLMHKLQDTYKCKFIVIGTPMIATQVRMLNELTGYGFLDLSGKTSLNQLVSLLKHCHVLISNDSGPVHVAAAVGTPVVSIFTRNQPGINPERWGPLNPQSKIVSVQPGMDVSFLKAASADAKYLELIETEQVFEAVDAIFKLC